MAGQSIEQLTLSPTKVDTFQGCRRLFKYKYLKPPFTPEENKYFIIGNIAHRALELFHKKRVPPSNKVMGECFKIAALAHRYKQKIKRGKVSYEDMQSIREMLIKYITYLKRLNAQPKIEQVEKLAKINVKGIEVWLKSDRIDKIGRNAYKVVDYKTGRPATKKDELASVQLPSYGLMIKQKVNKNAKIRGEYIYVKHLSPRGGIHAYEITDKMMQNAANKYVKVMEELKSGCKFMQNFQYKYCHFCDFKRYCLEDDDDGL